MLHFISPNLSNYFRKVAKWTKTVHDFGQMDKKCPLSFRRKMKTRKFENLEIRRFPLRKRRRK